MDNLKNEIRSLNAAAVLFLFVVLCMGMPIFAGQLDEVEQPQARVVIKKLAYIDAIELESVLMLLEVDFVVQPTSNTIVLRGQDEYLTSALRAIEALDRPSPNIEMTMYVVAALKEERETQPIPEQLEPVLAQLRGVFGYRGFELLDEVSLNVLAGRSGLVEGGVSLRPNPNTIDRTTYTIQFDSARVTPGDTEDASWGIWLDDLNFAINGVNGHRHGRIRTEVIIREGQTAVIGRSTPEGIIDNLVLIVEAQITGK
jgi:hypothetical protein